MRIISRTKAMQIMRKHNSRNPNNPASVTKFCTGKYKFNGSVTEYYDREVQNISWVLAVFPVRREDGTGPYTRLMSISTGGSNGSCSV